MARTVHSNWSIAVNIPALKKLPLQGEETKNK
jgi:hypothetical protein